MLQTLTSRMDLLKSKVTSFGLAALGLLVMLFSLVLLAVLFWDRSGRIKVGRRLAMAAEDDYPEWE